jgi:hypothetical protein
MSPEEIKLNYFFDQPNYKFKSEPEYLQYSEEDDCYSELTSSTDTQNEIIQKATLQSEDQQRNDQEIKKKAKQKVNLEPIKNGNGVNSDIATDHFQNKFYGLVHDADYFGENEFE